MKDKKLSVKRDMLKRLASVMKGMVGENAVKGGMAVKITSYDMKESPKKGLLEGKEKDKEVVKEKSMGESGRLSDSDKERYSKYSTKDLEEMLKNRKK